MAETLLSRLVGRATLRDIAAETGVSIATVSRELVQQAVERLGVRCL
jgi:uncharacterized protein YerC